jgi:glycosyltransferase involved in cell wall biosynthesis
VNVDDSARSEGGRRIRGIRPTGGPGVPVVSVVLAVYNAGDALERTLESVLLQAYPALELVIVDGGSKDGTIDRIRRYEENVDYWVSEPDRGVYDAYNKGVRLAAGEWLYFIGAGDELADRDAVVRILSPPPPGKLVYGNVRWGDTGKIYDGRFTKLKLCRRNVCHQAAFYHRDLFRELGEFDLRYPVVADWVFNLKCFGNAATRPAYKDTVVANFDLTGIASQRDDPAFETDKRSLIRGTLGGTYLLLDRAYRFQKRLSSSLVEQLRGRR